MPRRCGFWTPTASSPAIRSRGRDCPAASRPSIPVLREMEERGRVRRGYFVEGLGGAQFCIPAALDRLRAERSDASGDRGASEALILAASDPANPYGAALAWPRWSEDDRRPLARAAGAYVVLIDGEPVVYLERGGKSLQTCPRSPTGSCRARRSPLSASWSPTAASAPPDRARRRCSGGRIAAFRGSRGSRLPARVSGLAAQGCLRGTRSLGSPPCWVKRYPPTRSWRLAGGRVERGWIGSSASTSNWSRRAGKHLLIGFSNGLTLHTHLAMNGEWHRYRPGERWRRAPSRAVAVIETERQVAVCFDAPTVELIDTPSASTTRPTEPTRPGSRE